MSLQTWIDEFYPKPAQDVKTRKQALEHSLRKWIGLREKNLKKHDTYFAEVDEFIPISSSSCALCVLFYREGEFSSDRCGKCPLFKVRGVACDSCDDERESPYHAGAFRRNPEPMIALIRKAIRKFYPKKRS